MAAKIIISSRYGTPGDFLPMMGLAEALADQGAQVRSHKHAQNQSKLPRCAYQRMRRSDQPIRRSRSSRTS